MEAIPKTYGGQPVQGQCTTQWTKLYNEYCLLLNQQDKYIESHLDIIDKVRVFLCNEIWLTNEMKALTDNFGFRMEWQGLTKAEPIQSNENLVMGYRLNFESISFDQLTNASYDMLDQSGDVTGTVTFI